jgi:hypothetical protein
MLSPAFSEPAGGAPSTGPATVRIGIEVSSDLPIAFVQLTRGQSQMTLRGPAFTPVTMPANGTDGPLVVKTHYTNGGPAYETTLSASPANEWALTPHDLGLEEVTLDASAAKEAGARQVQIQISYKPSGSGTEDERTINFRYGDWTDHWYVVTRSAGLDGVIEYHWKATDADGAETRHPPAVSENALLKL